MKNQILHLSYDYSIQKDDAKTTAVGNLIQQTDKLLPSVTVSLDRVKSFSAERITRVRDNIISVKSFGLPYGLFLLKNLGRAYKTLLKADSLNYINFNSLLLVHSHKLTYEGYIGYLLSQKLKIPHFISLRQTDFAILKYRPDLHPVIKNVLAKADILFYIVPYMVESLRAYLGDRFFRDYLEHKLFPLPNQIIRTVDNNPVFIRKGELMTALRIDKKSVKRKNIKRLFKAAAELKGKDFYLNVIGTGPYTEEVKRWTEKFGIKDKVFFPGYIANDIMDKYYRQCEAFVMPSLSETFGLVYGEALMNGTPILYSRNTGFDGFFNDVGAKVNPYSVDSIAQGIEDTLNNNNFYREQINNLQMEDAFRIFTPEYSKHIYEKCLNKVFCEI